MKVFIYACHTFKIVESSVAWEFSQFTQCIIFPTKFELRGRKEGQVEYYYPSWVDQITHLKGPLQ